MSESVSTHKLSSNPPLPDFVALAEKLQETAQALLAVCQHQDAMTILMNRRSALTLLLATSSRHLKFVPTKFQITFCEMSNTCSKRLTPTTCMMP